MINVKFKITNYEGIHAKPATALINLCMKYVSNISLIAYKKRVDFKSIMSVLALGINEGTIIEVIADGRDEEAAINAIINKISELNLGQKI